MMNPQSSNRRVWLLIALLAGMGLGGVGARLDRYWSSTPSLDPGIYGRGSKRAGESREGCQSTREERPGVVPGTAEGGRPATSIIGLTPSNGVAVIAPGGVSVIVLRQQPDHGSDTSPS
jgi:hypothetical protein